MTGNSTGAHGDVKSSALWGTGSRGGEHRSNALWGSGRGGEHRSNALWGKGGRKLVTACLAVVTLALPLGAGAATKGGSDASYVAPGVLQQAEKNPNEKIRVIIQSSGGVEGAKNASHGLGSLKRELKLIGAVVAEMPAGRINALAKKPGLIVTIDAPVELSGYTSKHLWAHQNGAKKLWGTDEKPAPQAPTIAIIDSGIEKSLVDFDLGSRVIHRQVMTALPQDPLKLDGRGHGTLVAGIAAGSAPGNAGAAPNAKLVDIDTMDDTGRAMTSDVIAACDWILANKDAMNIKVANFSLHSTSVLSIRYHPLNKAVQKLWFSGVTVVAAAGNYGLATGPSGVKHSPGNDPFVITVGALDINGTAKMDDDKIAPWSAYGYTLEGFAKPEIVAAGRYMVGPIPATSTLAKERPENLVTGGYMKLSGTSFAAPVVSGIVAQMLARNPTWGPEQVKGAIMKTGRRVPGVPMLAQGRGGVSAVRAAYVKVAPKGNGLLNRFVVAAGDTSNIPVFDSSAWYDFMKTDSAWDSSAWADSAWLDSAWTDSAWDSSAWLDSAWNSSAWLDSAWADSATYADNAEGELVGPDQLLTPTEQVVVEADPDLALPTP